MNEESKRLKQYVIDAVVGGNLDRLGPSLASLWTVDQGEYRQQRSSRRTTSRRGT